MVKRSIVGGLVVLLVCAGAGFAQHTQETGRVLPKITIDGLGGAAHWLNFEAEDISKYWFIGGGGLNFNNSPLNSGLKDTQEENYVRFDTWQHGYMYWDDLHIPADMAAPKILVNYISEWQESPWSVHLDDMDTNCHITGGPDPDPSVGNIGQFDLPYQGQPQGSGTPINWVAAQLTAPIPGGSHFFGLHKQVNNQGGGFDNFLLYDGDIDASGAGTVVAVGDMYWQADDHAADYKDLGVASVTPVLTVTGAASVEYLLNGAPYSPGTPISGMGDYRLTVIAAGDDDGSLVQQRVMGGADFHLVPEPVSMVLLGIGGLAVIRRRK